MIYCWKIFIFHVFICTQSNCETNIQFYSDHKNLTHIFVVSISCKILNKLNLLNLLLFSKTIKSWSNYSIYENAHFYLIFKHFSESIAYNDVLAMN